jgi:cell pole-organizing protein PopZ
MSDPKTQQEPSMEEILASIRRIIAEDGEQAPPTEKPAATQARPEISPTGEEILELTEVVEGTEVVKAEAAKPAPAASAQSEWTPPEPAPAPLPESEPGTVADRLVSDATAAASLAALSQINQLGGPKEKAMNDIPLGTGQRTIEELIREMLRPLLKEWLDSNLPSLVERVVQDEVDRLVRDVRRR